MGNASSYATGPFLASIPKGPQNLGANLPHLPKLNEPFWILISNKHDRLFESPYLSFFDLHTVSSGLHNVFGGIVLL